MKYKLFIAFAVLFCNSLFAQDKISTHRGEIINCQVLEVLENTIKYKFTNESLINTIYYSQVEKIDFSSGRTQLISEKIIVKGEDDWEKVLVTNIPEEVKGLKRKAEVNGKATGAWGAASNAKKVYLKALEKLKKEAAASGAHIIYSKDLIVNNGNLTTGQWASSMISGIAYGYK